jgi:hypothetical protein
LLAVEVTKGHMTALRDWLVQRGLAKSTVEKALNLLQAMNQTALDDDQLGIEVNPLQGVKIRVGKESKVRPQWTIKALNKLFASPGVHRRLPTRVARERRHTASS